MDFVVSRGVGTERFRAPRMRFLCRPQVVIVDLKPR
jgi:predicted MPP superfamily phosphohydrolase